MSISAITSSNPLFTVTPGAPLNIAAGSSAQLTVRFSPVAPGAQSGTLTVTSNDPGQPATAVSLSGTGSAPTGGSDAYWRFDEGSGTVASDTTGNGITGTLVSGASWTSGIRGSALNLDGVDDYMDAGSALRVGSTFTIEAWIKGDPSMQARGRIVDNGYATGFALGRYLDSRFVSLEYRGSPFLTTTKVVIDNNWHHIVVVKSGGTATMYADGLFQNSITVNAGAPVSTLPVFVGYNPGEGDRGHWKGQLDEVHIYSRALTAAEILTNYNALRPSATSTPNPLAYWRFDETSGTIANDSSGRGHTAALLNGATRAAGIRGNALSLDGIDDYVSVTNSFAVTTANFTLEAWVKGDPSMEAYGRILDSGFSSGFALGRDGGASGILFEFRGGGAVSNTGVDNTWHHVAVVKSGGTATHWKGQLDEVRVYDRALTAAEVQNNYNARGQ